MVAQDCPIRRIVCDGCENLTSLGCCLKTQQYTISLAKDSELIDYKKMYEQALERARKYVNIDVDSTQVYTKGVVEEIFPELKESEDERIREDIISLVNEFWERIGSINPEYSSRSRMLGWLEKQKEPRDYRKLYKNIVESEWFKKAYENKSLGTDEEQKDFAEKKPIEWSEEDETGWTNTMIMIKECATNHYTKDSIKLVVDWLKSLKERMGG